MKSVFRITAVLLLTISLLWITGCSKEKSSIPVLTTGTVTNITQTTATAGGNVTDDGGASVKERGVCWSTVPDPDINDSKTSDGSGKGLFSSSITGLAPSTTYYLKAYATNSAGAGYGNTVSFTTSGLVTDIDGNQYHTVTIGTQVWMVENLKTTKYRNGDPIPNVIGESWDNLVEGAYCVYDNNESNRAIYGLLYNWYAADDVRNICPEGWHIPTIEEWSILAGSGLEIKEPGTAHWMSPNLCLPVSSGFLGLPGGNCGFDGNFNALTEHGYWWTAEEENQQNGWAWLLSSQNAGSFGYTNFDKWAGFSIRCIKD